MRLTKTKNFLSVFKFIYFFILFKLITQHITVKDSYFFIIVLIVMFLSNINTGNYFSKTISYYQEKNYHHLKNMLFKIYMLLAFCLGLLFYLIITMGVFDYLNIPKLKLFAYLFLLIPIYETLKAYFKGIGREKKLLQIKNIKDIFLWVISIVGIFLSLVFFKLSFLETLNVVFAILISGYLGSILYVFFLFKYDKQNYGFELLKTREEAKVNLIEEAIVLFKKLFRVFLLKLIFIFYFLLDSIILSKFLEKFFLYSVKDSEMIIIFANIWMLGLTIMLSIIFIYINRHKINNIFRAIKNEIINKHIETMFALLLFIAIPVLSFLTVFNKEICQLLFIKNKLITSYFSLSIWNSLLFSVVVVLIILLLYLKEKKHLFSSVLIGLVIKLMLVVSLMISIDKIGYEPFIGVILSTQIALILTIIMGFRKLYTHHRLNINNLLVIIINIITNSVLMSLGILLLKEKLMLQITSNIFINIMAYFLLSAVIYYFLSKINKTIENL